MVMVRGSDHPTDGKPLELLDNIDVSKNWECHYC